MGEGPSAEELTEDTPQIETHSWPLSAAFLRCKQNEIAVHKKGDAVCITYDTLSRCRVLLLLLLQQPFGGERACA